MKQRCSLTTPIPHFLEVKSRAIGPGGDQRPIDYEGEMKVLQFTDGKTIYMENPMKFTKKLLEMSDLSKVTGYKVKEK
jgi:hypothetical protein